MTSSVTNSGDMMHRGSEADRSAITQKSVKDTRLTGSSCVENDQVGYAEPRAIFIAYSHVVWPALRTRFPS